MLSLLCLSCLSDYNIYIYIYHIISKPSFRFYFILFVNACAECFFITPGETFVWRLEDDGRWRFRPQQQRSWYNWSKDLYWYLGKFSMVACCHQAVTDAGFKETKSAAVKFRLGICSVSGSGGCGNAMLLTALNTRLWVVLNLQHMYCLAGLGLGCGRLWSYFVFSLLETGWVASCSCMPRSMRLSQYEVTHDEFNWWSQCKTTSLATPLPGARVSAGALENEHWQQAS